MIKEYLRSSEKRIRKLYPNISSGFLEIKNIKALTIYGVFDKPLIYRTAKAASWMIATMLN